MMPIGRKELTVIETRRSVSADRRVCLRPLPVRRKTREVIDAVYGTKRTGVRVRHQRDVYHSAFVFARVQSMLYLPHRLAYNSHCPVKLDRHVKVNRERSPRPDQNQQAARRSRLAIL